MRILTEVAEARDVDPISLTPPLASVVDPDALEEIVSTPADTDVTVEFTYADCRITLSGDEVDVTPRAEDI